MITQFRRTIVTTLFVLSLVGLVVVSAQQAAGTGAQGQGASAGQPPASPTPTPSPRPVPPEQKALTDAMAITDPAARVAAIEKIREDFPQVPFLSTVDSQLLSQLVNNFPDRTEQITATFDRMIGRVSPTLAPENRVTSISSTVSVVVAKKLLLDKSEALLKDALAAVDKDKYIQTQKDLDKRMNRTERTQEQLEQAFGSSVLARPLELLGRIYVAKDDATKAEAAFKESMAAAPNATPSALALADLYISKGNDKGAEAVLNDALKNNATMPSVLTPLARLEMKRGDNAKALDHFMTASLGGQFKADDEASMKALYAKAHNGNAAGLIEALDKHYHEVFPNPVKAEEYKPSAARTSKLVLLELFTGSGCPPCVASDLAAEAAMERYGDHIISLAYHEHIPAPDPMVAANNNDRRMYYSVSGVPTFEIDGSMVANASGSNPGGGARTNTATVYTNYKASIDKALELPARATLDVKATGEGDQISVTVNVTAVPADAKDLRLHIVLAEKELRFTGENGIRFHPMAVRATVGDKGAGLPITATGTTKVTFSLNQIKDEITKSLATEMEKRHKGEAPGSTPREYVAETRGPYTAIDTSELVVVAFIQDGAYRAPKATPPAAAQPGAQPAPRPEPGQPTASADLALTNILNAAKTDVVFTPTGKTKGGGH